MKAYFQRQFLLKYETFFMTRRLGHFHEFIHKNTYNYCNKLFILFLQNLQHILHHQYLFFINQNN